MEGLKYFKDYRKEIKEELRGLEVIYTDLDGTLLNDKGCLLKDGDGVYYLEVAENIKKAGEKGWDIVLASGRNKTQLRYNAQMVGLKNYIAELGSELIYDLGKDIHLTFDHKKINFDITYGGKDLVRIIEILKNNFPRKIEGRIEWSKYRDFNALFLGEIDLKKANNILAESGYKGLCLVENGKTSLHALDLDINDLYIYNLIPEGVNKGEAIKLDKKLRNLNTGNCIALGDSPEDLKMARQVKYFFLMGDSLKENKDCLQEIKSANIYITSGKMNRGWVEVISYLAD
ncbi:MAG: HAD family hydrolase [Actinomycetota bacterium]